MTTIGETLAAIRHQAGYTLAELSARTCIRAGLLEAMERDDFTFCGGDFYARGHIRSVCRELGADPAPLVERFDTEHATQRTTALLPDGPVATGSAGGPTGQATDAAAGTDPEDASAISIVDDSAHDDHGADPDPAGVNGTADVEAPDVEDPDAPVPAAPRRTWPLVVAAAIVGAAIISVVQAWPDGGSAEEGAAVPAPTRSTPTTSNASAHPGARDEHRARHDDARHTKQRAATVREPRTVNVEVRAVKRSWVRVSDGNGEDLYTGVLEDGASRDWSSSERLRLRVGNAGGVRVHVNGEDKGTPGQSGEVTQVTYRAEDAGDE